MSDLAVQVAGAWRECECEAHQNTEAGVVLHHGPWSFVFPEGTVRIPCSCPCHRYTKKKLPHRGRCRATCRGWTVSDRLEDWLDAALDLGYSVAWEANGYRTCWLESSCMEMDTIEANGPTRIEGLQQTLEQALLAEGWHMWEDKQ